MLFGVLMAGCAVDEAATFEDDESEIGSVSQSLTAASFTMSGAYDATGLFSPGCSSLYKKSIAGSEPSEAGKYPVFVYLTGTTMGFNGTEAQQLTTQMAQRGFVAAAVDYDNGLYPSCSGMTAKASCVFNAGSANSAISKLCSRAKADCSKGVVVSGFSQGANLAALAKNYDARVVGAFLIGHGNKASGLIDVSSCANDAKTTLLPSQMRSVNGENDTFFGGNAAGVRAQLTAVVGVSCPNSFNCVQADGSGWAIVHANEVADGQADHCYYFNNGSLTCGSSNGFDSTWLNGTNVWSMKSNLDWLASKATH